MNKLFTFLCATFLLLACNSDDDALKISSCNAFTIIDADMYNAAGPTEIAAVSINEDCLNISYSASGCDGNTWNEQLIANNDIAESDPIQRYLALELNNNELCLAVISKEMSFDLTPLQMDGMDRILINLQGWNETILYEY